MFCCIWKFSLTNSIFRKKKFLKNFSNYFWKFFLKQIFFKKNCFFNFLEFFFYFFFFWQKFLHKNFFQKHFFFFQNFFFQKIFLNLQLMFQVSNLVSILNVNSIVSFISQCTYNFTRLWFISNFKFHLNVTYSFQFYMCCISLSGWSAPLPLWHKHPVTTRWRGQPGHGKPKGAVKFTDGEVIRGAWVIGFSQSLKIECGWCNSPREWCNVKKRLADVLGPINREPSSHSLQLPGWITAVWITAKWRMESHYVCCECDTSFRAHTEIHGQETG